MLSVTAFASPRTTPRKHRSRRGVRPGAGEEAATTRSSQPPRRPMSDASAQTTPPARARSGNGVVDEQRDHGADDRPDDARRLQGTLTDVLVEQHVAEEPADERTHDPEQDRADDAHRVGAGHQQPGDVPG